MIWTTQQPLFNTKWQKERKPRRTKLKAAISEYTPKACLEENLRNTNYSIKANLHSVNFGRKNQRITEIISGAAKSQCKEQFVTVRFGSNPISLYNISRSKVYEIFLRRKKPSSSTITDSNKHEKYIPDWISREASSPGENTINFGKRKFTWKTPNQETIVEIADNKCIF